MRARTGDRAAGPAPTALWWSGSPASRRGNADQSAWVSALGTDGTRVVFETAEALVQDDGDLDDDVHLEGRVAHARDRGHAQDAGAVTAPTTGSPPTAAIA